MKVSDKIRAEGLSADEAYERFFDGYYNLGLAGEVLVGNMVLSPPHAPPPGKRTRVSHRIPRRRASRTR
jgi:hypothetical protein